MWQNLAFTLGLIRSITATTEAVVTAATIQQAMRRFFPKVRFVGDKHPDYIFKLTRLMESPVLKVVVLYRDPRDVASSALREVRNRWKKWVSDSLGNASVVAHRWVKTIQTMERHREGLYALRYEEFVQEPVEQTRALAHWLGIDPSGLRTQLIHSTRVGQYKDYLTKEELDKVLAIAGPKMVELGYRT
jgi:hypothetical protein